MGSLIDLLVGIFLGFTVFFGALFSFAQVIAEKGALRIAYIIILVLILVVMLSLQAIYDDWGVDGPAVLAARVAGGLLVLPATYAIRYDERWRRVWPLALAVFGAIVASGAPFAA
ncbi:MAG: hypothetical protein MRY63_04085 [Neomegalonema sp.]|nr:hypothetical protein [Neomegalonema sp.]